MKTPNIKLRTLKIEGKLFRVYFDVQRSEFGVRRFHPF